ncbi:15556_t:CDS:1, partial [Entrophospora sp. SA101]
ILNGERPQITEDTPEFYAELMKRCWNHNPENRPIADEIYDCFQEHPHYEITSAELKRIKNINPDEFLSDTNTIGHLMSESIQQTESLNCSSIKFEY